MYNVFLRALRDRYPDAQICMAAGSLLIQALPKFLRTHTYIQDLFEYPDSGVGSLRAKLALVAKLRSRRFDLCVVEDLAEWRAFHGFLCGIPHRIGIARNPLDRLYMTHQVTIEATRDEPPDLLDMSQSWARACGAALCSDVEDLPPWFPFTIDHQLPVHLPPPIVAVHVGGHASWNRRWPLEHFRQLCGKICLAGASVYLVGGGDDEAEAERVRCGVVASHRDANIANLTGGSLNTVANYLAHATVFVGNDSAPMHIAAGLRKPVIVLTGPSNPRLWKRLYRATCITSGECDHLDASPNRHQLAQVSCEKHRCPYRFDPKNPRYPLCMLNLSVESVWKAVRPHLV